MSHAVVIQLIGVTAMRAGLTVNAKLSKKPYRTSMTVSAEEMTSVNFTLQTFHEEWSCHHTEPAVRADRETCQQTRVRSSRLFRFSRRPSHLVS